VSAAAAAAGEVAAAMVLSAAGAFGSPADAAAALEPELHAGPAVTLPAAAAANGGAFGTAGSEMLEALPGHVTLSGQQVTLPGQYEDAWGGGDLSDSCSQVCVSRLLALLA
jgi:hypothetical protein